MSRYTKTLTLGMGAYGNVSKAKDESGNEIYALKEFSLRKEQEAKNEGIPPTAIREVYLLKELNHINIIIYNIIIYIIYKVKTITFI